MPAESMAMLQASNSKMAGIGELFGTLKVDPSQVGTKPSVKVDTKSNLKDLVEQLGNLKASMSLNTTLAPWDLEWSKEHELKKTLVQQHPQCPGQTRRNWSIARMSG